MRRGVVGVVPVALAIAAVVVGQSARADDGHRVVRGPGEVTVAVRIDNSRFELPRLVVRRGTTVRFDVRNDDPIGHELVVGTADVHARHERGTEAAHAPVPGELSLPPLSEGTTSYDFDRPGTVVFACHLPGHLAYGMRGEVTVL